MDMVLQPMLFDGVVMYSALLGLNILIDRKPPKRRPKLQLQPDRAFNREKWQSQSSRPDPTTELYKI